MQGGGGGVDSPSPHLHPMRAGAYRRWVIDVVLEPGQMGVQSSICNIPRSSFEDYLEILKNFWEILKNFLGILKNFQKFLRIS